MIANSKLNLEREILDDAIMVMRMKTVKVESTNKTVGHFHDRDRLDWIAEMLINTSSHHAWVVYLLRI
jgi:hypothetical protein